MASKILTQILEQINSGLSPAQAIEAVVPGADLSYWQRRIAQQEATKQKPKRKTARRTSRPSRRSQYARMQSAIGLATAELVERVNSDRDTTARLLATEAAWHESNSILCAGGVLVR